MNNLKIIATDLDGTLLNSDLKLSKRNREALKRLKSQGVRIVLCTGRPFDGMKHLIGELGLSGDDYCISYNGSLVQSCDGKEVLHEASISADDFREIAAYFAGFGLGIHAMTRDKIYTYDKSIHSLTVRESYLGNLPITVLEAGDVVTEKIIKVMAVGNPEALEKAEQGFPQAISASFSLNKSEAFYLEIMQDGDNKARALKILLDKLNLSSEQLVAFGNNLNDLEMLNFAQVGVAVGNAVTELKEVSDVVTETNDHDGVAQFLEQYYVRKEEL